MVGKDQRRRKEKRGRGSCQESSSAEGKAETRQLNDNEGTFEKAFAILFDKTEEPENWQKHSVAVSQIAIEISNALLEMDIGIDSDYVTIGALLHDIGRRVDCGTLHGWEGFRILQNTEFKRYSNPCITHWLKGRSYEQIMDEGDLPVELVNEIVSGGNFESMTLEDKIICVSDAMARGDEIVTVKKRYIDARARYGANQWVDTNEELTLVFKNEIDSLLGKDLYSLFSELSE